jgi:hypothetical protein
MFKYASKGADDLKTDDTEGYFTSSRLNAQV